MLFAVAVFAPLLGSIVAGLFGKAIGDRAAQAVTILCMILASICGVSAFVSLVYGGAPAGTVSLGTWLDAGTFHASWALRYDALSAVMVAMVTCVATLIHIYSVGYMSHDSTVWRFFSYLSLFSFAMLMLVTADNLLQLFFGWEGVGLASYLLIGYWYDRPSACAAAIKAFVVNRIGDLGFAVGIALVFVTFGSIDFSTIFAAVGQHQSDTYSVFGTWRAYEVIGILLFIGAMGKSAQLGLHVWLPDAMEGPTPVSALIHAATMVTAGVFLMARFSPVLDYAPGALAFVTFIGGSTALFAATVGCVQNDIKRVIAYSTCSQLGYMFVAAGVGAYQASIFHLLTHAFFKALLFLGAGSVIHAMSDEQDMRKMGGIWKKIPLTYAVMWIGSLALGGVFPFAGYYSKDAILEAAWASETAIGQYGFWCGLLAAGLTAFYSWRLLILTFHGKPRADHHTMEHVHESPAVMTVPLLLLAAGAVVTGFVFHEQLLGEHWQAFWGNSIQIAPTNHVLHAMEEVPGWVALSPSVIGLFGIAVAYLLYMAMPQVPAQLAATFGGVYRFLLNKWYFDELYDAVIVRPYFALSRALWQVGDATIIDGIPNGLATLTTDSTAQVVKIQNGSIAVYAFSMLIGLVFLVSIFLLFR
ncbi:NADH-quinone oxidoreductase subunit L [Limobrevibacterium gyesilva]|uniref:NADH-quinone oxidoreductase subunit L n=1 Tax=Limobrevibacterium gyesilva TaxID=2991712 RepID=A0AA41YK43_9PROT|nr:NADH-quinone oxidoreductase subunit L [Limobrevibacterium gyesilva]MCW3475206.1 NADH-quinone oxidoreductase subunit L [Limobrevibacterium gyesilva]